ncbi:unnamed protein product [Closterium sp. Naga37s-1]|nr:unnamed protein product [Closterium sp. Naga37s-1]
MFQSYTCTVNGFAVSLTDVEAKRLKHHPAVARIEEEKLPADPYDPTADPYGPVPDRWFGGCEATADFPASLYNGKLIGAKIFNRGFLWSGNSVDPNDFPSARDGSGHGTWCAGEAAAAAGNANVSMEVSGQSYGAASGMAPRARIAMYKAMWMYNGYLTDIQAAVDAAVADGVDVLSLSLGRNPVSDYFIEIPYLNVAKVRLWRGGCCHVEAFVALAAGNSRGILILLSIRPPRALLNPSSLTPHDFCRRAGVFVAMSAGNAGPGTIQNAAPWYLTVGATHSTISRQFMAKLILGSELWGSELKGHHQTAELGKADSGERGGAKGIQLWRHGTDGQ